MFLYRKGRQFLPVSCFKMVGFHGQHLKVSAVALQLQSADTGRCQAFQIREARTLPASEACPPYLPASTWIIKLAPFRDSFSASNFSIIFGMPFFRHFWPFGTPLAPFGTFWAFSMHFGLHFGSLLAHFCFKFAYLFLTLFLHRFYIDFWMILAPLIM